MNLQSSLSLLNEIQVSGKAIYASIHLILGYMLVLAAENHSKKEYSRGLSAHEMGLIISFWPIMLVISIYRSIKG